MDTQKVLVEIKAQIDTAFEEAWEVAEGDINKISSSLLLAWVTLNK